MRISDWSSDVCSSDLIRRFRTGGGSRRHGSGTCQPPPPSRHSLSRVLGSVAYSATYKGHRAARGTWTYQGSGQPRRSRQLASPRKRAAAGETETIEGTKRTDERWVGKEGGKKWRSRGWEEH